MGRGGSDWIKPIDYKLIKSGITLAYLVSPVLVGGWILVLYCHSLSLTIIIIPIISQSNFLSQSRISKIKKIGKKKNQFQMIASSGGGESVETEY